MHHRLNIHVLAAILTSLVALNCGPQVAKADSVEKVRGKQAIIKFDDAAAKVSPGDKFFAVEGGRKKALLEVVKHKGDKAVVKIIKGKVVEGMEIMAAKAKAKSSGDVASGAEPESSDEPSTDSGDSSKSAGSATLFKDLTVGVLFGYSMDSQTVSGTVSEAMTGTGLSLKGFADIPVTGGLSLFTRLGAEQFNVQGTRKTEILYAVADLLLKYTFTEGSIRPFLMGGLGIHFPLSKSSDILTVSQISTTTVFYGGGGLNMVIGGSTYIQLTGEYGMFPPSNDVKTSYIAGRAGLGFRF